jgi:endonuclease YncB( thermonuclease family)
MAQCANEDTKEGAQQCMEKAKAWLEKALAECDEGEQLTCTEKAEHKYVDWIGRCDKLTNQDERDACEANAHETF